MPQVRNKSLFPQGTGVRFLASISLSENGMRTVRMKNAVQRNVQEMNNRRLQRLATKADRPAYRMKLKLSDSLRRMAAYKKVLQAREKTRALSYQESLDWNYSEERLKSDIDKVLYDMDPVTIRRRREAKVVEVNRRRYASILKNCKATLSQIINVKGNEKTVSRNTDSKAFPGLRVPPQTINDTRRFESRPDDEFAFYSDRFTKVMKNCHEDGNVISNRLLTEDLKPESQYKEARPGYSLPPLKVRKLMGL